MATVRRVKKGGGTAWQAVVRRAGFRPRSRVFDRAADAKAWARHTAEEMIDRYLRDVLPIKSDSADFLRCQRAQFTWWRRRLGATLLCHVTSGLLAECRDELRASGRSPATVNRYLAAVSHCLTVARKEWGWIAVNPAFDVRKCKEPPPKARPLSTAERERLFAAAGEEIKKPVGVLVMLALATGGRKSQLLSLRTRDVDAAGGTIHFAKMKGGKSMSVAVCKEVADVLSAYMETLPDSASLLFGKAGDMYREWRRVRAKAGLSDLTFHGLRHAFATDLNQAGASMAAIKSLLRHSDIKVTERYIDAFDREAARASLGVQAERVAPFVLGLPHGSAAKESSRAKGGGTTLKDKENANRR